MAEPELDMEGLLPDDMPEEEAGGGELPPGFRTAAEEMAAAEQGSDDWVNAFYSAILACKAAHE